MEALLDIWEGGKNDTHEKKKVFDKHLDSWRGKQADIDTPERKDAVNKHSPETAELNCPGKHGLGAAYRTTEAGKTCGVCGKRDISAGSTMRGCAICKWDVCAKCFLATISHHHHHHRHHWDISQVAAHTHVSHDAAVSAKKKFRRMLNNEKFVFGRFLAAAFLSALDPITDWSVLIILLTSDEVNVWWAVLSGLIMLVSGCAQAWMGFNNPQGCMSTGGFGDENSSQRKYLGVLIALLGFAPSAFTVSLLRLGIHETDARSRPFISNRYKQQKQLKGLQMVVESMPQSLLQAHITVVQSQASSIVVFSMVMSFISVANGFVSFESHVRQDNRFRMLSYHGLFTGLFRFGETCGRVLSLAIFSCSWGAWTCALLGVDFLILLSTSHASEFCAARAAKAKEAEYAGVVQGGKSLPLQGLQRVLTTVAATLVYVGDPETGHGKLGTQVLHVERSVHCGLSNLHQSRLLSSRHYYGLRMVETAFMMLLHLHVVDKSLRTSMGMAPGLPQCDHWGLYFVVIFATMLLAVAAPLAYLTDPAHPDPLWRDKVSQSVRTRHAKDFTLP